VYHWVVGQFSANSEKIPLLNKMWYTGNMSNALEILTTDRKDANVLRKFCFIKKYAFLRELLMHQKCIIGGWCIISRWMTVRKAGQDNDFIVTICEHTWALIVYRTSQTCWNHCSKIYIQMEPWPIFELNILCLRTAISCDHRAMTDM